MEVGKRAVIGELVLVITGKPDYHYGWGIISGKEGKFWKVLFSGELIRIESNQFERFLWYNRHLLDERQAKMVSTNG